MREFFIGLLVLIMMGVLSVAGILLLPFFLLLGLFLRFILGIVIGIFLIWAVGKLTLFLIDAMRNKPAAP